MCILLSIHNMHSQGLNFYSSDFENAVKRNIGISDMELITQEMADAIMTLDFSGLDLADIRDIVYFRNLEELNLSYNRLTDLTSLINLKFLERLNVSGNLLKTVDVMFFSEAITMAINLSNNYIEDYSLLLDQSRCKFTLIGLGLQKLPYRVNDFYTDYDFELSKPIINYNLWTYSLHDSVFVENNLLLVNSYNQQIKQDLQDKKIFMTLGSAQIDSTYYVAPSMIDRERDSIVFVPQFPDSMKVLSVETLYSKVYFNNDSIILANINQIQDTVKVAFGYLNSSDISRLKGYTYFIVKDGNGLSLTENKSDRVVTIYPNPANNFINIACKGEEIQLVEIYSQTGRLCLSEKDTENLNISSLSTGAYIVRIYTNKGQIEKMLIKK